METEVETRGDDGEQAEPESAATGGDPVVGAWRRRNPVQDASRGGPRRRGCQIATELRVARRGRGAASTPARCAMLPPSAPVPALSLPFPLFLPRLSELNSAPLRPFPPFLCAQSRASALKIGLCAQKFLAARAIAAQVERLATDFWRLIRQSRRRAAEARDSLRESSRLRELATPRRLGDYTATIPRLYRDSKIMNITLNFFSNIS